MSVVACHGLCRFLYQVLGCIRCQGLSGEIQKPIRRFSNRPYSGIMVLEVASFALYSGQAFLTGLAGFAAKGVGTA